MPQFDIEKIIEQAERWLDEDPHLANYMLRDTQAVKNAGLADLAWAMHQGGCVKNDVVFLIECLRKWLDEHEVKP